MREDLEQLIEASAREVAETEGATLPEDLGPDSPLFGKDGIFDSLGLVSLIVAVEEAVSDRFGRDISLADERALSRTRSPYRTIGTLMSYADELLSRPEH